MCPAHIESHSKSEIQHPPNVFFRVLHKIIMKFMKVSKAENDIGTISQFLQIWKSRKNTNHNFFETSDSVDDIVNEERDLNKNQPKDDHNKSHQTKNKHLFVLISSNNREAFTLDILAESKDISVLLRSVWKWFVQDETVPIGPKRWQSSRGHLEVFWDSPYAQATIERNCERINQCIAKEMYEAVHLVYIQNLNYRSPIWSDLTNKKIPIKLKSLQLTSQITPQNIKDIREKILTTKKKKSLPRLSFLQTKEIQDFLWICPNCFSQKTMQVRMPSEPEIYCQKCNSRWWIDVGLSMNALTPIIDHSLREIHIYEAIELTVNHIGKHPIQDKNRYSQYLTICMENTAQIFLIQEHRELIAVGELYLQTDCLYIQSRSGRLWDISLSEILATRIWDRDELLLECSDYLYCIRLISGNAFMWQFYIECWMQKTIIGT